MKKTKKTYYKNIAISVIIILLFSSCNNNNKDVEITQLNPVKFPEASDEYRIEESCYYKLFIIDSFLIMSSLCDLDGEIKKIHVYNKKNLQLITKFGTEGLASYSFPGEITPLSTIQNSNNIRFYDSKIWQFKTVNLDKYLMDGKIAECVTSSPMDQDLIGKYYINELDEQLFMGRDHTPLLEGMFFIYDAKKKKMNWIEPVPNLKGISLYHKVHLHYGELIANRSKKTILFATRYFDQVLFYDFSGKLLKQLIFSPLKKPVLNDNERLPVKGSFFYASSAFATSEYCFVRRMAKRTGTMSIDDPPFKHQLVVFNWDGLLINVFDEYTGEIFCYDEEFGNIYTKESSKEENDPHSIIRKYHIGDYLKTD